MNPVSRSCGGSAAEDEEDGVEAEVGVIDDVEKGVDTVFEGDDFVVADVVVDFLEFAEALGFATDDGLDVVFGGFADGGGAVEGLVAGFVDEAGEEGAEGGLEFDEFPGLGGTKLGGAMVGGADEHGDGGGG